MKIEAGKFYKTRDGRKARIYAVNVPGQYCMHGAIESRGRWLVASWDADYMMCERGFPDKSDLVAEWEEPKPKERRKLAWIAEWTFIRGDFKIAWGEIRLLPEGSEPTPNIIDAAGLWARYPRLDEPEAK